MSDWVLTDLRTGEQVRFENFSDCIPDRESPLDVEVGDLYNKQPPEKIE